jgi:uncharacterized protein
VNLILSEPELRVFGVLVEKELAVPDSYPMSLNAATNACNQKTNREPITNYDDATVQQALDSLREKGIGTRILGDRVPKYGHRAYETLNLGRRELALLSVMMLRGPQTTNELKERTQRMHDFGDLETVELVMRKMCDGGFAVLIPRQPGQREARWAHLLAGEPIIPVHTESREPAAPREDRIGKLEQELASLRAEFDDFKKRFE